MSTVLFAALLILFFLLAFALLRTLWGPTAIDRMLSVQLMGTVGVAVLATWGATRESAEAVNVALVFALLAVVATVAFVRRGWPGKGGQP